ncbi:MAG: class I SAM-dependent methyltransferase [Bacteroidales bacterium]|nr:class I SAM-dependent methyltransferase [Bacteroidales bacterium]
MSNQYSEIENLTSQSDAEFLTNLVNNGGPFPEEYERFTNIVNNLKEAEINYFRDHIRNVLTQETLIGHGFVKPFGYPGDFNLIDKIYRHTVNESDNYKNWDTFFQNQPAAEAVRNRKDYFVRYCRDLVREKSESKVLILGSGPATDVYEFLSENPGPGKISFDLIDFDQSAIDFSKKQNEKFSSQISYNRINALRYNSYKLYDLIWSAGLFDYFKDKHFTFLIRKYFNCLTEDGEMVISNFSTRNPTNRLMEVLSDWNLNLRTESDLFRVASDASINKEFISIDKEPLGINLFLKIRKSK